MNELESLHFFQKLTLWLADIYWTTPRLELIHAIKSLQDEQNDESESTICQSIAELSRSIDTLSQEALSMIAVDYTSLFCGTGANEEAPFPYESIYLGEQRLLMQSPCGNVNRIYVANNYQPNQSISNEPADHISFELGYVAYLLDNACAAMRRSQKRRAHEFLAQKNLFMQQHLQRWLPRFCEEVRQQAATEFFRQTAVLTKQAVTAIAKL
jgi:TorA maturation chaperone TorD